MKEQIIIKVDRSSGNHQKPIINLFERIIDVDTSIVVPYQTIVETMRFLYGSNVIISISSCAYGRI